MEQSRLSHQTMKVIDWIWTKFGYVFGAMLLLWTIGAIVYSFAGGILTFLLAPFVLILDMGR